MQQHTQALQARGRVTSEVARVIAGWHAAGYRARRRVQGNVACNAIQRVPLQLCGRAHERQRNDARAGRQSSNAGTAGTTIATVRRAAVTTAGHAATHDGQRQRQCV